MGRSGGELGCRSSVGIEPGWGLNGSKRNVEGKFRRLSLGCGGYRQSSGS